ncbi:MAG TPA: slipin family protein [Dehalococcoidales bacterium]|nr:slipin family protein [Dehalococcoidales bacterium]
MSTPIIIGIIALIIVVLIPSTVKILKEYERGVIFRLGRLLGTKGPGFFLIIPFVDQMTKRDLRVVTMDVTPQEVITKDNITVRVNAVIYFRVVNPEDSVVNVNDYIRATSQIAQTTLRNVLGQSELDELLTQREKLNLMLQKIIDEHTDPWGIKVATVEIKEVELPEQMRRMMAAQAEAERERRAKIIHAEGEFQASEKLAQAGAIIAREPVTLQLRYLQTLTEIATEKNSTVIFPLPMDLIKMFMERGSGNKSGESDSK